jgi:hypothetical protein
MAGEIIAGLSAFKTMFDIATSLKGMNDAAIRNKAVAELGEQIIAAQTRYATAAEQIRELEEKLRRMETWEAQKQRYELKDLKRGFFAYILKEGQENDEPAQAICTNCYKDGIKSILQCGGQTNVHERTWNCPECGMSVKCQFNDMAALIKLVRAPKAQASTT